MLPSMPLLFNRDSQDAFGNNVGPSTSFFVPNTVQKSSDSTFIPPKPPAPRNSSSESKLRNVGKRKSSFTVDPLQLNTNSKESELISVYYSKVQNRLSTNRVPNSKFIEFQELLKTFNINKNDPIELFNKVKMLFGEEHKDLADEFLMFLSPGQATKIGRFMDYTITKQMQNFLELLQKTFARKPAMLRKILKAISNSINCNTTDEVKSKVMPHLRSNPRLMEMFKTFFPDERPPDSLYESNVDTLKDNFLTEDVPYEFWEFEEKTDNKRNIEVKTHLDTTYLQGRVFLQYGRNLRPANITYPYSKEPYRVHVRRLAPAHSRLSPTESDDEQSPRRKAKTTKRKQTKDHNDNTKLKETDFKTKTKKNKKERKKKEKGKTRVDEKKSEWTRDEDKTMLEMLKGGAVSDKMFVRIKDSLPNRSVSEIKDRFFHVMNLLQQMEVT